MFSKIAAPRTWRPPYGGVAQRGRAAGASKRRVRATGEPARTRRRSQRIAQARAAPARQQGRRRRKRRPEKAGERIPAGHREIGAHITELARQRPRLPPNPKRSRETGMAIARRILGANYTDPEAIQGLVKAALQNCRRGKPHPARLPAEPESGTESRASGPAPARGNHADPVADSGQRNIWETSRGNSTHRSKPKWRRSGAGLTDGSEDGGQRNPGLYRGLDSIEIAVDRAAWAEMTGLLVASKGRRRPWAISARSGASAGVSQPGNRIPRGRVLSMPLEETTDCKLGDRVVARAEAARVEVVPRCWAACWMDSDSQWTAGPRSRRDAL